MRAGAPRRAGWAAALLVTLAALAAPSPAAAAGSGDDVEGPPVRIAVAEVPGLPGFAERLAGEIRRDFARARFLTGRFTVRVLDAPLPAPEGAGPEVEEAVRRAAGDATFLIRGRMEKSGPVLYLVHLYTLDPAYASRQATGRAPVVPTAHRLPSPRGDDPLMTLYALQGVVYAAEGRSRSALQVLSALNDFPDLEPEERYPVVFFIAQSQLALGLHDGDGARVDEALYHFGALTAVLGGTANRALAGATLWNRGLAYQLHPGAADPARRDQAVASYEAALPFFPARRVPVLHARLLQQLAWVEQGYPPDPNGAHLFRAILAYRRALSVWTADTFPEAYRAALHNTAVCFQRLPVGDREGNLRTAIRLYGEALAVPALRHRQDLAASTYGNLGQAWQDLPPDPDGSTLLEAVSAYREALRYWTLERNPRQFRRLHTLAGQAFQRMPAGDPRENGLRALAEFDQALKARPREADPTAWALIQFKRGVVLASLPPPGEGHSLAGAKAAFEAALEGADANLLSSLHDKVVKNLEGVNARLARLGDNGPSPEPATPGPGDRPHPDLKE